MWGIVLGVIAAFVLVSIALGGYRERGEAIDRLREKCVFAETRGDYFARALREGESMPNPEVAFLTDSGPRYKEARTEALDFCSNESRLEDALRLRA
jgi:hypothetical protein